MKNLHRIAVSAGAVGALVAPVLIAGPANAGYDARVSIHATDHHVRSGEQFRVHGRYLFGDNRPVTNKMIRVQSKNPNGRWVNLRGAHLRTNSSGGYRIRVVLSRKGVRKLRVKAQGPDRHTPALRSKAIRVHVR